MEYLSYDSQEPEEMKAFVNLYPYVLTAPSACAAVLREPNCYESLKDFGWWATAISNVDPNEDLTDAWLTKTHIQALAYDAPDAGIATLIDWPAWEVMIQEHGPLYVRPSNPNPFSCAQAFVALANRIDPKIAPLMCAAMHVLLPLDTLDTLVSGKWTPLQKAQYAWLLEKTENVGDIWPATRPQKDALAQAQEGLSAWTRLVDFKELASVEVIYGLNGGNLEDTIFELIQLAQTVPTTDAFDYTVALNGP